MEDLRGEVDDPHPAAADLTLDPEPGDLSSDNPVHATVLHPECARDLNDEAAIFMLTQVSGMSLRDGKPGVHVRGGRDPRSRNVVLRGSQRPQWPSARG